MTSGGTDQPFVLKRRQLPVRLAFAMSINKAQGQTLKRVGIYLPQPVFAHGQLYVAISRVGDEDRVFICVGQDMLDEHGNAYAKNVMRPELLLQRRIAM
jgi:ATP-dependent DNA helicase PIF1